LETDPPPTLGQDTTMVLETVLGYSQDRLEQLAGAGAFGRGRPA
jgi:hypothetical protein